LVEKTKKIRGELKLLEAFIYFASLTSTKMKVQLHELQNTTDTARVRIMQLTTNQNTYTQIVNQLAKENTILRDVYSYNLLQPLWV
jgi:hypothetical protein